VWSTRGNKVRFSGSGVFGVARIWLLFGLLLCLGPTSVRGQEPEPVVHAVLFYSPTCPHCHEVITKFLIPLQNEYGRKLVIMGLDTSQKWANELFWEALRYYNVPEDRWAVPFMIVDDRILVGGDEIPANLPTIIDEGLASGGIDLPNFPALIDFMAKQNLLDKRYPNRRIALQAAPESSQETEPPVQGQDSVEASGQVRPAPDSAPATPEDSVSATPEDSVSSAAGQEGQEPGAPGAGADSAEAAGPSSGEARPSPPETAETAETGELGSPEEPRELAPESGADSATGPLGLQDAANRLESMTMMDRFSQDPAGNSFSVLVLFAMILSLGLTGFPGRVRRAPWPVWVIPLLVILGVGVASYLSFVEVTQVEAVCGPVGDCNTVNQSQYATLFGFLPVGVLGLLGYGVILLLWSIGRWGPEGGRDRAKLGLWGAAVFGVLFSIYLTFLEPFVIGATCAWCLSSAVIMTLLLWASAPHAAEAWPGKAQGGTRD
jgi:uncharacterized membrane protein